MNASGRRCRQFKNGFRHLAPLRRPHYKKVYTSVQQSIEAARNAARREQARSVKKK